MILMGCSGNAPPEQAVNPPPPATTPVPTAAKPAAKAVALLAGETPYVRAFSTLRAAPGYHFILTTSRPGESTQRTEGDYEASRRGWHFTMSGGGEPGEWLRMNSILKNYRKVGDSWKEDVMTPMQDVSVDLVIGCFAPSRPDMQRVAEPPKVGVGTIEGSSCDHYHFTVSGDGMYAGTYDAYLNSTTGQFAGLTMVEVSGLNNTVTFSRIGDPVALPKP